MSGSATTLYEWETQRSERDNSLAGRYLDEAGRRLAEQLKQYGCMEVLELSRGLEIRATSFIGRITLGDLTITVRPKIRGAPFLNLLRYSYQLRDLHLYEEAAYDPTELAFQDLLVRQLTQEIRELLVRGIHREYERVHSDLTVPRGRIEFDRLASARYCFKPVVPCIHHPRSEDTLLNQVLLAGLVFAHSLTTDAELRADVVYLIKTLNLVVSRRKLTSLLLAEGYQAIDRRTRAYRSAMVLIDILFQAKGASLEEDANSLRLPGFLFDMNRFFQALISRYLHDHLQGYEVHDEHRLQSLFSYSPDANPRGRRAPVQKPDFVVRRKGQIVAIVDTKYRDLWHHPFPREMLYQLALYALAHPGKERKSVILYPTRATAAGDQVIQLRELATGASQAHIILRPVKLLEMEELLRGQGPHANERRAALAHQLSFGSLPS